VPVDVSESALTQAGQALIAEHPGLGVHALIADFTGGLALPGTSGPRLVAFLLSPGDTLLLGTDLVKDESVLVAAYDDSAGVTAELCGPFILSVVRTTKPTRIPRPRLRSRTNGRRTPSACPSPRSHRATTAKVKRIRGTAPMSTFSALSVARSGTVPASVASSASELRSLHSADVASTEKRAS
jgi:hypothetical protein